MAERLIYAEALKTKIQILLCEVQKHGFTPPEQIVNLGLLLQYIDNAPTIEAKPVVHAHWVTDFDFDPEEEQELYFYFCSKCKKELFGDKEDFKYCPYCGAQMDEVADHIAEDRKKEDD